MSPVRHLVLFVVQPSVSDAAVAEAITALRDLGEQPGIVSWRIELSRDLRKGRVIVENALFVDRAAFTAFRLSPEHQQVSARLAAIADWLVGDYLEQPGGEPESGRAVIAALD